MPPAPSRRQLLVGPRLPPPLAPSIAQHVFVASSTGTTIFRINDDLSPAVVGFYNSTATFGQPTSVAYNPVYDELAISVRAHDALTRGQVYIVSSVEDWIG